MTLDTNPKALLKQLRLPQPDLSQLSFCLSNRASRVATWASQLPATRINHTSVLLYQALPEVCRLNTTAANRLEMLEHLRPYVQQCIQGLSQAFLGKPLILPDHAQKAAVIAQALQKHMSNGYCLVIKELVDKQPQLKDDQRQRVSLALHRAITGMGLQFLRNSQIYTPVSNQLWLELNSLYFLAEQLGLLKDTHHDTLLQGTRRNSIEQAYGRILLLACANPNQLRQHEVNHLYEALEDWSRLLRLVPCSDNNNSSNNSSHLYAIQLGADQPPGYKSQVAPDVPRSSLRELNLTLLLNALQSSHKQGAGEGDPVSIPNSISDYLLSHTLKVWSEELRRHLPRKRSQDVVEVAVGLTSIHYHLAGQLMFEHFLQDSCQLSSQGGQFNSHGVSSQYDSWDSVSDAPPLMGVSIDEDDAETLEASDNHGKYPLFQVQVADISPAGYGLNWREQIPPQAVAGELIALRSARQRHWNVGVIRWVRQHRGASQLGVQLIAQNAHAIAIQQLQQTSGDHIQMRGLISHKAGSQLNNNALITASFPFRANNKVRFNREGVATTAQLSKLLQSTSSINVFSYRQLDSGSLGDDKSSQAEEFADNW